MAIDVILAVIKQCHLFTVFTWHRLDTRICSIAHPYLIEDKQPERRVDFFFFLTQVIMMII